ncbi:Ca2+-binding RTX toxin-like protein [Actinoplanes lutulentus]|uniref:Hemolysin type calcium-binding protein n=1 Tax=Actinoplanes lutulentus TaxID=1287878 RepID=A0A327YZQ7_9ACTN|nr:calcium-binding protein [Actinoplanes lutulentus]MBB2945650.1 Ca2+-binding RTX toxin-like protein [Actinoplanes lutulentus]RAK27247.1 hemolysin type calcium-binding protein [Actinoplanes lutulentus]
MSHSPWLARIGVSLITTVAVGAVAAPASAAPAGVASVSGTSKIVFKAAPGKANSINFSQSGRTITINDSVPLKAGKGCKPVKGDKTKVKCTTKKAPTQITAHLGDKNDALSNRTKINFFGYAGTGDDKLYGGPGYDRLVGDSGNDRIWGGAGNDSLDGSTGNDQIDGGAGTDKVYGSAGSDRLTGGAGNDYVYGGTGNDTLYGGAGNDRVVGEVGHDVINGEAGNDSLDGGAGNDRVLGGTGDDKLYGSDGDDELRGDDGNDKEYGGAGNDRFVQATTTKVDADLFAGGTGKDEVTYAKRETGVTISNNGVAGDDGTMAYEAGKTYQAEHDTISTDIEVLVGGDGSDRILGGPDNDFLYGMLSSDYLNGGAGDDYLNGGGTGINAGNPWADDHGRDDLVGGAGNDRLEKGDLYFGDYDTPSSTPRPVGADVMIGGNTVSYEFADGPVTVDPHNAYGQDGQKGEGDEVSRVGSIIGSPYADVLISMVGDYWGDYLSGKAGDDYLRVDFVSPGCCDGWNGVIVRGGDGADEIDGGDGPDVFLWGSDGETDDGDPDVLSNAGVCHVHSNDTATGCGQVGKL